MDKEKEIEEMADVLWGHCGNLINEYCEGESHCANCIAKKLTEAGYRKAEEVRKETAREFKQTMKDIFRFVLRNKGNTSIPYFNAEELVFAKFDKEVDREFLQEYGVEVDE